MTAPDQDRREHGRRDQSMRNQNPLGQDQPDQDPGARDPRAGQGAKTPPKPFTIEAGHRKVRSFVLRRAAGISFSRSSNASPRAGQVRLLAVTWGQVA